MSRFHSRKSRGNTAKYRPQVEQLESLLLLSFADGNGPVVTGITGLPGSNQLVIRFDGPLSPGPAPDVANYQVTKALANPELVTKSGPRDPVIAASYNVSPTPRVTLTLRKNLTPGTVYRIWINGTPASMSVNPASNPLTDINGVLFDGDNDDTAGGDFYGQFSTGRNLSFVDSNGAHVSLNARRGGLIDLWRELDGDIDQLSVVGPNTGGTVLSGAVTRASGARQTVYIGSVAIPVSAPLVLNGALDSLPSTFVTLTQPLPPPTPPATAVSPQPVLASSQNLPFTLSVTPLNTALTPLLQGLQSAVSAHAPPTKAYPDGLWLFFGGRTNGLHNFTPSGVTNFPSDFQNEAIIVVNPATWQTWSLPWSQTNVAVNVYNSLSSGEQEFYQKGNTLYTMGGYSVPDTINFTGNTTAGSTTIGVSDVTGLAVGQNVSGPGIPLFLPNSQTQADVTITAVGTNSITISQAATATATGVVLTAASDNFTTYDTLSALNIKGMVSAVINGGNFAKKAAIRQISNPRFQITGGDMTTIGGRTYVVFGQDFQGGYSLTGPPTSFTQIYSDEIRSFQIVNNGKRLGIRGYTALRDPVNFRRRDGNTGSVMLPSGRPALTYYGGVFTIGSNNQTAYQAPIVIVGAGNARIDSDYQQFFDQYTTTDVPMFDQRTRSMDTIFLGGIGIYDYQNGQVTPEPGSPWVDDVSTLVSSRNGLTRSTSCHPCPVCTAPTRVS